MIAQRKNALLVIIVSLMICFIGSCAGDKLKVETIALTEIPKEQVNHLDNDLTIARKNQVNVLSPSWFAKAEASYFEAKKALEDGDQISKIMDNVALGRAQLKRAEEIARLSRMTLPDVIKARNLARNAGATSFTKQYIKAEKQFFELTEEIEKNNVEWAQKNRGKVAEVYRHLELQAIKLNTLGQVKKLIEQAEREGSAKRVPETLQSVKATYRKTEEFIAKHRYEREEMHKKVSESLFQAQRLIQLNQQSKRLQTMNAEQVSLWAEGILYKVTQKILAPDMRNENFDTQLENIIGSISALKEDREFMINKVRDQQAEMDGLRKQIASLEGKTLEERAEIERLAEEKRFQQLFVEVQSFFEPEDAEIYKQGNQLIIRLRAIHFPVGSYVLMPHNYELLNKVQKAIRTFGEPNVVIEGHTDSTGSDTVNEQLSENRAESVRQYLVANEFLPASKILSVGYGAKRPLASNQTEEGRAVNRRIDVVIIPQPHAGM